MKKGVQFFILSLFCLLAGNVNAQWNNLSHTSGTLTVSGVAVTVSGSGSATTYPNWCGGVPYWIGSTGVGSYTFTFATAVTGVKFELTAMDPGETLCFNVNGSSYPLSSCNKDNYLGTCGTSSGVSIVNGCIYAGSSNSNASVTICNSSITSVTISHNGTGNGTTFSTFFTTGSCALTGGVGGTVTAGANTPSCGGNLNLTSTTVTGALSYSWTGPNGFTSSSQNPTINGVNSSNAGTYTVTVTTACGTITSSVTVTINTPSPPTVNTPINYCQGAPTSALVATGQNLLWYTTQTGGTGSSTAPIPSSNTPGTFTWWVSQTINGCESARTPITVNVIAIPTTPVLGSNSPLCAGQTLNLTSNIFVGGVYAWTGPGFVSAFQNPSIGNAQSGNSGNYCLTVSVGGCTSQPACIPVVVNPLPTLSGASAQNPTTCGGTNGQITLNGLTAGTTYTINYTKNGVAQPAVTLTANNLGQVVITGLGAGTYAGLVASVSSCASNALGPITLTGPTPPNINVTVVNANNCNNPNGSLTISGLNNGTYTVNYSINGTPVPAATLTAGGGQIIISNLAPGVYSNITVTTSTTNCTSNIAGPITIGGPVAPNITLTQTSPTTCGGSDGTVTISGVVNGSTYTVNWSKNGTAQPPLTLTGNNGSVVITGLSAGVYSNITVTLQGCTSNIAGPITITDPSAPVVTIGSNSAICAGQTLNLTSTSSLTGSTFTWSGPNGFTSSIAAPSITNATTAASGTYTVVVSAGSCSTTMTTLVTVNPSPVTPIAGVNNPICQGNSINLTSTTTTTGVTYDWSGPGGYTALNTQNPTIANATTANNGQYTVIATANGCSSVAATVTVNVTATPAIQYTSSNPTACGTNTGSITLNGLITGSSYLVNYDKNGVPQTANLTAGNGAVIISNLGAGTYTNITVSLNGCPSNIVGPVTLSDPTQPPTPVVSNGGPYCAGDNIQITTDPITGANWSWSGPAGFNGTAQSPSINNAQTNQGGTYTVVAVVNGCSSQPASTTVVVNPIPAQPVITANSPLCEGNTLTMGANTIPGVTYSWSGPNNFSSPNQSETINNVQPVMNGIYTVTVSNGTCSNSEDITVTVNPIPGLPTVVSPLELCQFEQVQLTAQGQNLQWYTQATGGTASTTVTPPSNIATTMTYYVSQSVNGCEGPRAQLDVIVKPQPQVPTAQQNYNYCQDEPVAVLSATGTNIQWYDVATGGSPLGGVPTLSSSVSGIFHYYVTQTVNGCESPRLDITIMVNEKPDLPVVEQMTLCQDDPVPPFNVQGQNLLWYDQATGGTGSASLPQINTSVAGTTDYYVSQTVNGCEGDRSLIRVTINPKVEALFVTDKDTICDSYPLTVTFTGTAPTTADFDWNFSGATVESGTGAGPYTISWNNEGPKTITVTVSNLNCSSTTNKTIYVLPTPTATFSLMEDACPGDKIRVQAGWDQMEMPGYAWDFSGAQVLEGTGGGPYTLQWNTPGDKVISLSLTNIPCPSLPYTKTISIHLPQASVASVSSDDICTADSVLFTATPGLDYSYQWSPAIFFGKGAESTGLSAWGKVRSNGYVWLTVTDRWGCSATDSVLMSTKSCCEVFLPNVFSPNADGKNDVFRMVTKGHQTIKRFIIMNRWGKIVFDTANQYEAWDGTFNGEPQDIGTYQYYLKYECADNGELIEMKGDVTLVR